MRFKTKQLLPPLYYLKALVDFSGNVLEPDHPALLRFTEHPVLIEPADFALPIELYPMVILKISYHIVVSQLNHDQKTAPSYSQCYTHTFENRCNLRKCDTDHEQYCLSIDRGFSVSRVYDFLEGMPECPYGYYQFIN